MAEFINTIDILGDNVVTDSIINRTITEFKDETLTTVGAYAFSECNILKVIELPNVTTIGSNAFLNCTFTEFTDEQLPSLTILSSNCFTGCPVTKISLSNVISVQGSFTNSNALTELNLPNLTTIEMNAFNNRLNSLKYVVFPSLKSIDNFGIPGMNAVEWFDCASTSKGTLFIGASQNFQSTKNLYTLIIRSASVASLAGLVFKNTPIASGTGYIYVPKGLVEKYKTSTNWSAYDSQFRAIEDYTIDGTVAGEFKECEGLSLNVSKLTISNLEPQIIIATIVNAPIVRDTITWSTNDKYIAYVIDGRIFSVDEGTATITATCGAHNANCIVTVEKDAIANILTGIDYERGYVNDNGMFVASNNDRCTQMFDVSEYVGETLTIELDGVSGFQAQNARIVYYSESGGAVGVTKGTVNKSSIVTTVPNGAVYARISVSVSSGGNGIIITKNDIVVGAKRFD